MINGGGSIRCCPLKLDMGGHISTTGPLSAESFGCSERGHPGAMFQNASASGRRSTVGSVAGQPTASGRAFSMQSSDRPTRTVSSTGPSTLWMARLFAPIRAPQVHRGGRMRHLDGPAVDSAPRFTYGLKVMGSPSHSCSAVGNGTKPNS